MGEKAKLFLAESVALNSTRNSIRSNFLKSHKEFIFTVLDWGVE